MLVAHTAAVTINQQDASATTDPPFAAGRKPSVSVCIPTYNRSALLREAIGSVLQQTFEDLELIVYDNASTDDTAEVVKSFGDERIRYFRNPQNLGHRENWRRCFRAARGQYIAPLPDDDMMLPENLSRKVQFLRRNPHVGLVHSKYHVIDPEGQVLISDTNWGHGADRTVDALEKREDLLTAFMNTINLPTVVFTRACYERVGEFSTRIALAYDWEYWMRIAIYYDIAFLAEPLVRWRIHSGSLTKTLLPDPMRQLREDLTAKRELFRRNASAIPGRRQLAKQMWWNMGGRLLFDVQVMVKDGLGDAQARAVIVKVCLSFPELLKEGDLRRTFLKSLLGRPVTDDWRRSS